MMPCFGIICIGVVKATSSLVMPVYYFVRIFGIIKFEIISACPVLTGIKWVSNKWIHERGQEFRRPCGLTPGRNLVVIAFIKFKILDVKEHFVGDLSPI